MFKFSRMLVLLLVLFTCSSPLFAAEDHTARYLRELSGVQKVNQQWLAKNADIMKGFFDGRYTFIGQEDVLYFPSARRNLTGIGYQNYPTPPKPWYAKIGKTTGFTIKYADGKLVVMHVSLTGAYHHDGLGGVVQSMVALAPMSSSEKVTYDPKNKMLVFRLKKGVPVIGGCKVEICLKKLANGDMQLTEHYTGWAAIPSPAPIRETKSFLIKRVR